MPKAAPKIRRTSLNAGSDRSALRTSTNSAGVLNANARAKTESTVARICSEDATRSCRFRIGATCFSYAVSNSSIRSGGTQNPNRARVGSAAQQGATDSITMKPVRKIVCLDITTLQRKRGTPRTVRYAPQSQVLQRTTRPHLGPSRMHFLSRECTAGRGEVQ